jgi:hypothetical protein
MPLTTLHAITRTLLDESSSEHSLFQALDEFTEMCSDASGIYPDPSYSAWADDTFLNKGVAINPKAAAQCVKDYRRSIVFIRGVHQALRDLNSTAEKKPINILYAGCGPYATLLLPLLSQFSPDELSTNLLDIHQTSLDSVALLLAHFNLTDHHINYIQADACRYQHTGTLDLIISETMQKSLEQEPQFAIMANLGTQLSQGSIFIPEEIRVSFALVVEKDLNNAMQSEPKHQQQQQQALLNLTAANAAQLSDQAYANDCNTSDLGQANKEPSLELAVVSIPETGIASRYPALLTDITVYKRYELASNESDITLVRRCFEIEPLIPNQSYTVNYQMGQFPHFSFQ